MGEGRRVFEAMYDGPHEGCDGHGPHFHDDDWSAYWGGLTEGQQQSLRDKARWEHMSLSAVAASWGASEGDR